MRQPEPNAAPLLLAFHPRSLVVLLSCWLISGNAAVADYPVAVSVHVNDYAQLLQSGEAAEVMDLFFQMAQHTGVEATLVTISSIHDYGTGDDSIESFATGLFNHWGIGDRERHDGVLVLVAVKDRQVRIELGQGHNSGVAAKMQQIIDREMVPWFRRGDFGRGTLEGTRGVVQTFAPIVARQRRLAGSSGDLPAEAPTETRRRSGAADRANRTLWDWWITGSFYLLLGGFGLSKYLRYRRLPRCPRCRLAMAHLDEAAGEVHLESGQQAEEVLGSVIYDVWKCERCNYHAVESNKAWRRCLKSCPKCGYRTVSSTSRILQQSTYSSSGRQEVRSDCAHCDFESLQIVVLPMLQRVKDDRDRSSSWRSVPREDSFQNSDFLRHSSSSSSRSSSSSSRSSSSSSSRSSSSRSFGGGRSSGRGATGSW